MYYVIQPPSHEKNVCFFKIIYSDEQEKMKHGYLIKMNDYLRNTTYYLEKIRWKHVEVITRLEKRRREWNSRYGTLLRMINS
jgi:uncharacterized protein YifN (PemK superfamily)